MDSVGGKGTLREVYHEDIEENDMVDGAVSQPDAPISRIVYTSWPQAPLSYATSVYADPDTKKSEDITDTSELDEEPEELKNRKLFGDMDEHAKRADMKYAATYRRLRNYLKDKFPADKRKHELYLVRGLLVWLCHHQNCVDPGMDDAGTENPLQLIKALALQQIKLRKSFELLCKKNDIKCDVVNGTVRGAVGYEVGDTDCKVRGQWNVVTIDGKQRLIHAVRACSATIGYETGGWIKKESDGVAMTQVIESDTGHRITRFNDFWFCTDPLEFINYCYPDESEWQLLSEEKKIENVEKFLLLPMVTEAYCSLGLKLTSENTCGLMVDGDKKMITFENGRQELKKLHYNLFVKDDTESSTDNSTERMVLDWMDQKKNTFSFELRFAEAGTYKLQIDADTQDGSKERLSICDFKIVCKTPTKSFRHLPIEPQYGWGCTHKAAEFGLVKPSLTTSKIPIVKSKGNKMNPEHIASLMFTIKKEMVDKVGYKSSLHGCDYTTEEHASLQKYVRTDVDVGLLQLTVQATVPTDGEFALVIEATLTETGAAEDEANAPVCAYLLTTLEHRYTLKIPKNIFSPKSTTDLEWLSNEFAKSTGKRITEATGILASRDQDLKSRFIRHLQFLLSTEQQLEVAAMIQRLLTSTRASVSRNEV